MLFTKSKIKTKLDQELIDLYLKTGDIEILGELFEPYMHLVYGVCLKYLKNRSDAQDMVIQIFEDLQQKIPQQEILNFKSWLYVVTKNNCLMYLRKNQFEQEKQNIFAKESLLFVENVEILHPVDRENNEEMEAALRNCIEKLKSQQRSCIELFYYEAKCYQEISEELQIDMKKVKSYIQNGKRNLKICLELNHVNV